MYALRRFGIKLGLDVIGNILSGLGNPHLCFSAIHIAGTNGKGSIASALASILNAAGHKVGLYTSPHLVRFNERICINNRQVSDDDVVEAWQAVKKVHTGSREPTFFEYTTAMALYLFKKTGVELAIMETGMGGRLDATNIVKPALCLISNISLEHRFYLGNTISAIAGEKAGIIKQKTPVVCGITQPSAIDVIEKNAAKHAAPLFLLKKDFRVRSYGKNTFTYYGKEVRWPKMCTPLPGDHQKDNAALVLAACEILMKEDPLLTIDAIRKGLAAVRWPGRLEIIGKPNDIHPEIILDGAHNLDATRKLAKFLKTYTAGRKITLIIGILDDKPYKGMLNAIIPLCNRIIITEPDIDRAFPPARLLPAVLKFTRHTEIIPRVKDAVDHAINTTSSEDMVCVAGSLYVVGEARQFLEQLKLVSDVNYHKKRVLPQLKLGSEGS
ncbi:MAG: bifunctional folylpolyglutamate synthase/dihydrofolate synthase [Deltaproteobacteria bacterium]|nr:bifunctional folylpolyglutamate synthase/dihydrofolate synthase [Deltaproteobacteria bacterium]